MCGSGPAWKREDVPDHKFDFIDVRDFHSKDIATRFKYVFLYVMLIKSFLVYMSDIFTAITMISTSDWSNQIQNSCQSSSANGCIVIPFNVAKWLFVGCIIFSFLLLAYEGRKAKKIIASRDISYAFTNVMAQDYYSIRSYDHFCLFCTISNSTKKKDDFAFFVFFTFKGWKRLLLADGPRQSINAMNLYSFYLSKQDQGPIFDLKKYSDSLITTALIVVTLFTVLMFVLSMALLILASILYVPLLFYIRGNLKEYCCHKVDKRIEDLIKRKKRQQIAKAAEIARKEAAGDFSHTKGQVIPQPTLPSVSLDDDEDTKYSRGGQYPQAPNWQSDYKTGQQEYSEYPPPMPVYQPHSHAQPQGAYATYGQSVATLPQEDYNDPVEYGSTYDLAAAAAPFAAQERGYSNSTSSLPPNYNTGTPTSDAYSGYVRENAYYGDTKGGYNYTGHTS